MQYYRRIMKICYRDHVTNETVLDKVDQKRKLLPMVKSDKLKYFGHISRHTSLEKDTTLGTMPGLRRQGGQRKEWSDDRDSQDVKSQDRDETETLNPQDRDETETFQTTSRDRFETETFKTETTSLQMTSWNGLIRQYRTWCGIQIDRRFKSSFIRSPMVAHRVRHLD